MCIYSDTKRIDAVCICTYAPVYVRTHLYMYVRTLLSTSLYLGHVCVTFINIWICIYIYIYVYIYGYGMYPSCICMCVHALLPLSPYLGLVCVTYMYIYMQIYIFVYIHRRGIYACSICTCVYALLPTCPYICITANVPIFYRALLQKRPIILRSLLLVATTYAFMHAACMSVWVTSAWVSVWVSVWVRVCGVYKCVALVLDTHKYTRRTLSLYKWEGWEGVACMSVCKKKEKSFLF